MDKRILNKIAKEWCKGILLARDGQSFDDDSLLDVDEQIYILQQVDKIAERITPTSASQSLVQIINKYYKIE